jgi:hypothetical protein
MDHTGLGATAIETSVAARIRASAAQVAAMGNAAHAAEMNSWAAQLESDPAYSAPAYTPPPAYPFYYNYNYPYFPYYPFNFHPIDTFLPFFSSGQVQITQTTTPGRITSFR